MTTQPPHMEFESFTKTLLEELFSIPGAVCQQIKYGHASNHQSRIRIQPAGFFESLSSPTLLPPNTLPLPLLNGIPLLYGVPVVEETADQVVIHADLVASSFFLMTRYEEIMRRNVRDRHGRFPGKESLPARGNFIDRPIVDEYGAWLRQLLREQGFAVSEPNTGFQLTLTHDVDHVRKFTTWKRVLRASAANCVRPGQSPFYPIGCRVAGWQDPYDTFDWIADQNQSAAQRLEGRGDKFEEIYFFIAGNPGPNEGSYRLGSDNTDKLVRELQARNATIGLHPSYAAGGQPSLIEAEVKSLSAFVDQPIRVSRHHYLRCCEPEHLRELVKAGLTDDYTGGYADCPGFRYGTCRPHRYFDPIAFRFLDLTVHPLQIMEVSFESPNYLGLSVDQAVEAALPIIQATKRHAGELVLLFHNNSFAAPSGQYHRNFYRRLLCEATS